MCTTPCLDVKELARNPFTYCSTVANELTFHVDAVM